MLTLERLIVLLVFVGLILLVRRARMRTERVDGLRKTMNEAVIHDLKNPMTSVMGCVSCVLEDELEPAQRRKLLELALHGCRATLTLLETLVDTSRLENGELPMRQRPVDVRALLAAALDEVRGTSVHLGISLEQSVAPGFPAVIEVDPDLFPRVMSNLLHNALKYTREGGRVSLHAAMDAGRIQFEVRDNGIGIEPENIARLFEKYYRVEGTSQAGRRGSGLGLYFCRMVIEAHGGAIRVSSRAGEGTSIWFSLPAKEDHGLEERESARRDAERVGAGAP